MNWTGGKLSRHSRAAGSLTQRQKQHFAKVQNNLRNGPKNLSQLKQSIVGNIAVNRPGDGLQLLASAEPRNRHEQRSIRQLHGIPRSTSSSDWDNGDRHYSHSHDPQHMPHYSPTPQVAIERERVADDDLYNATPPPRKKGKRELPVPLSDNVAESDEKKQLVSEKRRRLLRKGDWVGTNMQKPLRMAFASPRHGEKVGRRRKITSGHKAQYSNPQSTITSPFGPNSRRSSLQTIGVQGQRGLVPGRSDVRISIGSRAVPSGISSSTASGRRGQSHSYSHPHRQRLEYPQAASSDVMLLDNEYFMERPLSQNIKSQIWFEDIRDFSFDLHEAVDNTPMEDGTEYDDQGRGGDKRPSGRSHFEHLKTRDDSLETCQHESLMVAQSTLDPRNQNHNITGVHRPIFSSSSASMHHPIPQNRKVSLLLHSGSSESPDSTVAQVGKINPTDSSSQVLDNEIWKRWLSSLCDDQQSQGRPDEEASRSVQGVTISPGISTARAHYRSHYSSQQYTDNNTDLQIKLHGTANQKNVIFTSPQRCSKSPDYLEIHEPPQGVLGCETPGQRTLRRGGESSNRVPSLEERIPGVSNIGSREIEVNSKEDKSSSNTHHTKLGGPSIAPAQSATKAKEEADLDEVWKRFVFDSSSNEEDEIIHDLPEPDPSLRVERREDMALSVMGNPPTEASSDNIEHARSQRQTTYDSLESSHESSRLGTSTSIGSSHVPWNPPTGGLSTGHIWTRDNHASVYTSFGSLNSSQPDAASISVVPVVDARSEATLSSRNCLLLEDPRKESCSQRLSHLQE